jgi:hypothetical protein
LTWLASAPEKKAPPAANAIASTRPTTLVVAVPERSPPAVTSDTAPKRTSVVCVITPAESTLATAMTPPPATTTLTLRSPSKVAAAARSPPVVTTLRSPISACVVPLSVPLPRAYPTWMIPPARASAYRVLTAVEDARIETSPPEVTFVADAPGAVPPQEPGVGVDDQPTQASTVGVTVRFAFGTSVPITSAPDAPSAVEDDLPSPPEPRILSRSRPPGPFSKSLSFDADEPGSRSSASANESSAVPRSKPVVRSEWTPAVPVALSVSGVPAGLDASRNLCAGSAASSRT